MSTAKDWQASLRKRRKKAGLRRLELWCYSKDAPRLRRYAQDLKNITERESKR